VCVSVCLCVSPNLRWPVLSYQVVLAAVRQNGLVLRHASAVLRATDPALVLAAVCQVTTLTLSLSLSLSLSSPSPPDA
jgi:hypothetical protein